MEDIMVTHGMMHIARASRLFFSLTAPPWEREAGNNKSGWRREGPLFTSFSPLNAKWTPSSSGGPVRIFSRRRLQIGGLLCWCGDWSHRTCIWELDKRKPYAYAQLSPDDPNESECGRFQVGRRDRKCFSCHAHAFANMRYLRAEAGSLVLFVLFWASFWQMKWHELTKQSAKRNEATGSLKNWTVFISEV